MRQLLWPTMLVLATLTGCSGGPQPRACDHAHLERDEDEDENRCNRGGGSFGALIPLMLR